MGAGEDLLSAGGCQRVYIDSLDIDAVETRQRSSGIGVGQTGFQIRLTCAIERNADLCCPNRKPTSPDPGGAESGSPITKANAPNKNHKVEG